MFVTLIDSFTSAIFPVVYYEAFYVYFYMLAWVLGVAGVKIWSLLILIINIALLLVETVTVDA